MIQLFIIYRCHALQHFGNKAYIVILLAITTIVRYQKFIFLYPFTTVFALNNLTKTIKVDAY